MLDIVHCLRYTLHRPIQRFENWLCFRHQVIYLKQHPMLDRLDKANLHLLLDLITKNGYFNVTLTSGQKQRQSPKNYMSNIRYKINNVHHNTLIPRLSPRRAKIREQLTPTPNILVIFSVFILFEKHWDGRCFFFFLDSLNTMQYSWKTCSSCRAILMYLSVEGSKWCIFIFGTTPRICETAKYKPAKSEG
jgi:hypothetical protein